MESLRGIFPRNQPVHKRDFLRENVMRIKTMQYDRATRKPKDTTEYSTKYKQINPRKLSLNDNSLCHRSSNPLQLCSSKAPLNNLRKAMSTMTMQQHSRDIGVQTVDPESDQYFLKDSIIRYPSASTVRSLSASQQTLNTCSRRHLVEDNRPKYKNQSRRDREYVDQLEKQPSNMSDYFNKTPVSKKPSSILKTSSSLLKLNKDSFNESQQKVDRCKSGSSVRGRTDEIVLSNEDDENNYREKSSVEDVETEKEHKSERKDLRVQMQKDKVDIELEKRKQKLKEAAEDPNCPEGHILMDEDERLNSLKLAQKRGKELIDELNRLPMTCETLRVRNRKIEIEKELKYLDQKIRLFSRTKVYVKLDE
ncbi:hypothetical protein PVAND_008263 [Polypedilum vanderplanki]|uniref:Enkurin domain-containing protein n=1 Tax=Polypedilum vanderplanki TaxID=319348 RepID=A0A9J6C977_POLVA|nr:hypothetical protein PVAND_008263 [Polypedilum vanderplanki]